MFKQLRNISIKNMLLIDKTLQSLKPVEIEVNVRYTGKILITDEELEQIQKYEDNDNFLTLVAERIAKRFLEQELQKNRKITDIDAIYEIYFNVELD